MDTPADAPPEVGTTPVHLVFGPSVLMMTEGQTTPGVLTVSLDREWSTDITVTIVSSNSNVATVVEGSVTFPATTTGPKEIHILAPVDDDTVNDTTTIVASAVETGSASVTVNVDDPDIQSLLAFPPMVSMTEGRTESLSVRLAKKPASAVVVTLASSNTAKLTLDTATLTFDATNYSIPQPITLTAVKDDDALNEHVTVSISATGNIASLSVPVDITDIDAVNLDITPSSLALVERAATPGTIMVSLTKAPPNDMNVAVSSSDVTKVTATPALLLFTADNFSMPQAVMVTPVPDNDGNDESEKITFTASGITPAPDPRDVAVTIKDTDSQAIMAVPGALDLAEGATTTFTVQLSLIPSGDTTVNVFSQNSDKIQVSPPVLHFNAATYNMPQTVTVVSLQDDDLADDDINITLIASATATVTVAAHVTDDDHQAILLVPAGGGSTLTMQEGASSALGVRLAFRPSTDTTVTLGLKTLMGPDKLSVSVAAVPFSSSDYANPKFVTLMAAHLPDMVDIQASVTASSSGVPDVTLPVDILDIDTQNLLVSTDSVTVSEGMGAAGAPQTFTLKLALQPPSAISPTFILSPSLTNKVTVDSSGCASLAGPAAMTAGCTVTVTPLVDTDIRKEMGTITISAPGLTSRVIDVTVTDTDTQGVMVSSTSLAPITEGSSRSFTVTLTANPVDPVTVSVLSGDPAHFSVSPATLAFTSGNFASGIPVTVTALDDNDIAGYDTVISVQGAAAGATVPSSATVMVSETNTDVQAIVITPGPSLTMLEGSMAQLGVRLAYRPVTSESVSLAIVTPAMTPTLLQFPGMLATITVPTPFDGTNYSTNQFVNLTSLKDDNMVTDSVTVTASSTNADTPIPPAETVTITDIDALNFNISSLAPLVVPEGNSATPKTFTVGLTVAPASAVTVSVSSNIPTSSLTTTFAPGPSVLGGVCTLTTATSSCTVNVVGVEDLNALNELGTITISGGPASIAPQLITVSTVDNDMQGLTVLGPVVPGTTNPTTTIHESMGMTTATFTVALQAQPPVNMPITVNVLAIPDVMDGIRLSSGTMIPSPGSGTPVTLTFDSTNYNSPQTVTISGVQDNDLKTDPFSIRVSAPGLGVTDQFVSISEIDDDTQHILISRWDSSNSRCLVAVAGIGDDLTDGSSTVTSLGPLAEDGSSTLQFCVSLEYQPLSNTVVDIATSPSPQLSGAITHLSFSTLSGTTTGVTGGYDQPKAVSFTASSDNDAANEAGEVNLSSSGFAATRKVDFTISDPDRRNQQLTFTGLDGSNAISISKGSSGSVGVRIAFDPIATTMVMCGSGGAPVSIMTPTTYTFTGGSTGTWSTPQTITINVATDANPSTEPVTVTCTTSGATPSISPQSFTVNATTP